LELDKPTQNKVRDRFQKAREVEPALLYDDSLHGYWTQHLKAAVQDHTSADWGMNGPAHSPKVIEIEDDFVEAVGWFSDDLQVERPQMEVRLDWAVMQAEAKYLGVHVETGTLYADAHFCLSGSDQSTA
jgi:hypothetical protein